jgi:hypothetical protein
MTRYDRCDDTCTTDCGHCKGAGKPMTAAERLDEIEARAKVNAVLGRTASQPEAKATLALVAALRAVLTIEPTWHRGMYGCQDDMISRASLHNAITVILGGAS